MIRVYENKRRQCYECWDKNGRMFFYYEKPDTKSICIKRTEFREGFDESESFRIIIETLVELFNAMNLMLTTECPWIRSYIKTFSCNNQNMITPAH